jgi:hypothetical protein
VTAQQNHAADSHIDSLFERTLEELEELGRTADPYKMLSASALLRKLLIDGDLVSAVNRPEGRRLKIRYCVWAPALPDSTAVYKLLGDELDGELDLPPQILSDYERRSLSSEELRRMPIVWARGKPVASVDDAIRHLANSAGGVHFDPEGSSRSRVLDQLSADPIFQMVLMGAPYANRVMPPLARVVCSGLDPLLSLVRNDLDGGASS